MPYKILSDPPNKVRKNLPKHAQEIFKNAFNSAWKQYKSKKDRRTDETREEVSFKVAWAAVKHGYKKGEGSGKWVKRRS